MIKEPILITKECQHLFQHTTAIKSSERTFETYSGRSGSAQFRGYPSDSKMTIHKTQFYANNKANSQIVYK